MGRDSTPAEGAGADLVIAAQPQNPLFCKRMFRKIEHCAWMLPLLLAVACNRPSVPATQSNSSAAPFSNATSAARSDSRQLSSVVAEIVAAAHRSGAVIYRVQCGPERSLEEQDVMPSSPEIEPMREAPDSLSRSYPGLTWNDSQAGVRVLDKAASAGLLKVHIREFTVIEDRSAETALAALWRTPEVIRYMADHDLRFARSGAIRRARRGHGVLVVHMKNATVEEIVQQIAASYPNKASRFWSYRECRRGAETLVEIKIL
jgi:hypothetical protein